MANKLLYFICCVSLTSCVTEHKLVDDKPLQTLVSGIDVLGFDKNVRPQDDFFRYVNGTWLDKTIIPADKSSYGMITGLYDQNQKNLKHIIELTVNKQNKQPGSDEQKVGDFYKSYMNTDLLEVLGLSTLNGELQKINNIKNMSQLSSYFAHADEIGAPVVFGLAVNIDSKQPSQYISYLTQVGLSLPDRDYYLKDDEKLEDIRSKYVAHVKKIFILSGVNDPQLAAEKLMMLEMDLAKIQWSRVQNRDRDKTYNKYGISDLNNLMADFDWLSYLKRAGVDKQTSVVVRQPSYFQKLHGLIKKYSIDEWKIYFKWSLVSSYAPYLNNDFVKENFEFYFKTLRGIKQPKMRWKRAVDAVNANLGELVGKVYVKKHFKPEAKTRMVQLVENLRQAFNDGIRDLDWMTEETKKEAFDKLKKFTPKIGYPDKWRNYNELHIHKDRLLQNVIDSNIYVQRRMIGKLGMPIDRTEWHMNPQTVNAYYNPSMNEIVFPAAILQAPFFNIMADDAVNYGAIGAVIGHEMGHGFDDQGSKSDGEGKLRNWWTKKDLEEFKKRTKLLVDQYNKYYVFENEHINGELTLGENIGDLSGLGIAYKAYNISLNGRDAPIIDGLTGDQRFFIGWAQAWRIKYRDEALRNKLLADPHSPARFRVMGVLTNIAEFYQAFSVSENDQMYLPPEQRVKIW